MVRRNYPRRALQGEEESHSPQGTFPGSSMTAAMAFLLLPPAEPPSGLLSVVTASRIGRQPVAIASRRTSEPRNGRQ